MDPRSINMKSENNVSSSVNVLNLANATIATLIILFYIYSDNALHLAPWFIILLALFAPVKIFEGQGILDKRIGQFIIFSYFTLG